MRIYKCILKILSPTVIGDSRSARGYYTTTEAIPGHTIGGAVNRAIFGKSIGVDNKFISSPAYPIFNGHDSLPAHPFYYECKVCGDTVSTLENNSLIQIIRERWGDLWEYVKEHVIAVVHEKSDPVKSLHPRPVVYGDDGAKRVDTLSIISVGMNRHTASSQYGLLYEYTAIEPGQEYWFTLASHGRLEHDEFEVKIGRGTTRGLGRALVKAEEIDGELPVESAQGDVVTMYALSPIPLRFLSDPIDLEKCGAFYGLDGVDGVLEPLDCNGRPVAFGRTKTVVAGWSFGSRVSRQRIVCLSAGSIVSYTWKNKPGNLAKSIKALRYFGVPLLLDDGYVEGFCMLHPFVGEPLKEVK